MSPTTRMTAPAQSSSTGPADPRTLYLDEAEAFSARHRGAWPFRYLRWYARCDEGQLDFLIRKIYCDSLPEAMPAPAKIGRSAARSLLHPLFYVFRKKWLWSASPRVDFDMETIDRPYFDKWFAPIYAGLEGTKRLTPRHGASGFDGFDATEPISSVVALSTLLRLLFSPLVLPSLILIARRTGRLGLLDTYRKALSFYALFDGHFRRYPCRNFVTYADETNHPARYIAFKQNCPGLLYVVQNGERSQHPAHAFGMVDVYFSFGAFGQRLFRELRMHAPKVVPVGALCLNERHELWTRLEKGDKTPLYDVLLVDQSVWPLNGVDQKTGESFFKMFRNLNTLKERRPDWRIAYQLRNYPPGSEEKKFVLSTLSRYFKQDIAVLDNEGRGDSYASIYRSRLVITFSSTLGVEAFFFGAGKKTLFYNYSGNPYDVYAPEPRFQLEDETGEYAPFEKKVEELLALELPGIPASVLDHHCAFDGRVQQRIAAALNEEAS